MTEQQIRIHPGRRGFLQAGFGLAAGAMLSQIQGVSEASGGTTSTVSAGQALKKLMDGNRRFFRMRQEFPNQTKKRLRDVSIGQSPFVCVLSCIDSRVPPELVFDQGLGDILTIRVAGNIMSDEVMGSIEFGVEEFGIPLVVVLGHESCGAATAALNAYKTNAVAPGKIGSVVMGLRPAVQRAATMLGDPVENVVTENIRHSVEIIRKSSPVLAPLFDKGKAEIIGMKYGLTTGIVELFD